VEGGPLTASRDRALILIGFAGGLRRSELAGIEFEHFKPHSRGITVTLPKSETDREGRAGKSRSQGRGIPGTENSLKICNEMSVIPFLARSVAFSGKDLS